MKLIYNVGFLQNSNRGSGIISNDQVGGFKLIIIYKKFYLFIRISGEYVSGNQCFEYFFIWFIIVVHLVTVKKFDICLLAGWSSTLFILLVNIFTHMFNLFVNNIVKKPIIDETLFYVFYLFINIVLEEEISLPWDIRLGIITFLYLKEHPILKLRVQNFY